MNSSRSGFLRRTRHLVVEVSVQLPARHVLAHPAPLLEKERDGGGSALAILTPPQESELKVIAELVAVLG
jgi:hypothetical protein